MGMLGPHEGKELDLMRKNLKKVALFYTDSYVPEEFSPYLENKTFHLKELILDRITYYIIYKPEYQKEADELSMILLRNDQEVSLDNERKIGKILGYNDEDIEYYINHISHYYRCNS